MKAFLLAMLAPLLLAAPFRLQAAPPKLAEDYVIVIRDTEHPEMIPYSVDLTLLAAVTAAGDWNEFSDNRRVVLIRGGKKELFDMRSLRRDPSKDPGLQPWDIVYFPPVMF